MAFGARTSVVALVRFLGWIAAWHVSSGAKCGYPGSPAFGRPVPMYSTYEEGKSISYTCNGGYFIVGQPTRDCLPNGTWSGELPICDTTLSVLGPASASDALPQYPPNMAIDGNKASCFYSNSRKPRWWRVDLKGDRRVLSVAITVPSANQQHNFHIFVISVNETKAAYNRCAAFSGVFASQKAILVCGDGKGIVGKFIHIEDYRPQYDYFGLCEVEIFTRKEKYECGEPERPANGFTVSAPVGTAEYKCISGYRLQGAARRHCQPTGKWTGPQPVCEEVVCKSLRETLNGRVRVSGPSGSRPVQGSKAFYTCDPGYLLKGNRTRTCQENSWWSGDDPICQPVNCGMPDVGNAAGHFLLLNGSTSFPSLAELRCKSGEEMMGDSRVIQCKEDGVWSRLEAQCIIQEIAAISQTKDGTSGVPTGAIVGTTVVILLLSFVILVLLLMRRRRSVYHKEGSCSPTQVLDASSRSSGSQNGVHYFDSESNPSYQNEPFYAELQKRLDSRSVDCASSNVSTRNGTPSSRTPLKGRRHNGVSGSRWAVPSFRSKSKTTNESSTTSRKSSLSSRENIYEEITFGALRSLLCNGSSRRPVEQASSQCDGVENGHVDSNSSTDKTPDSSTSPGAVDPSVLELYAKVDFSKKRKNRVSKDSDDPDMSNYTEQTDSTNEDSTGYDVLVSDSDATSGKDSDVPFKLRELPPIPDEEEDTLTNSAVPSTHARSKSATSGDISSTHAPYLLLDNAIYAGHPMVESTTPKETIMVDNELYSSTE